LSWLARRESAVLPRIVEIAAECLLAPSYYAIDSALCVLVKDRLIARRTGTRSEDRGHCAIRVIAIGRVFKMTGCSFEPPDS
jgi:hypothetical protein